MAIWLVIVIAIIALVFLYCRVSGVVIPPWIFQAFWIVVAAVVIIFAIRFVASM